jgi:transglycosylase-like protein with SLT domain
MSNVGLRKSGERRRQDRRGQPRTGTERRRANRRGAAGGLLLSGLALAGALHHTRGTTSRSEPMSLVQPRPSAAMPPPPEPTTPFAGIIEEASKEYGVDAELIRAVIQTESRFDPMARSRAGAMGLMQIMPILARELDVKDPFDPRENIFAGVKYLSAMLERHSGDVALALASYNAGPRNVARFRGVPPFKETRNYVKKIQTLVADASDTDERGTGAAD